MIFNSFSFLIFITVVFTLYWVVNNKSIAHQNLLIVVASYTFYGWWDWKFLSLIMFSTLVDFSIGILLLKKERRRKLLLATSIIINIGLLGFFKYFNFFIDSLINSVALLGYELNMTTLNIGLPIGISFYSFQTLSYTFDIYKRKIEPTRDFIAFAAFVSFFPQLVAGPIERASSLLPQFYQKKVFDLKKAVDGLRQILWGLFKKMVIADNCAEYVNLIFDSSNDFSGSTLLLGAFFFSFQIYGDFSGYSDIAIGSARLFGVDLNRNFAYPYFSRDIAEFWRRWHISLSTWFRDYLYIPLGGSRGTIINRVKNTFVIFLVSGLWHGANWTFVMWGLIHAVLFIPLLLGKKNRNHMDIVGGKRMAAPVGDVLRIISTFIIVSISWIFFRADSIGQAINIVDRIFSFSIVSIPDLQGYGDPIVTILLVVLLIGVEWIGKNKKHALENMENLMSRPTRWALYSILIFLIGMFMVSDETPFIYFQF